MFGDTWGSRGRSVRDRSGGACGVGASWSGVGESGRAVIADCSIAVALCVRRACGRCSGVARAVRAKPVGAGRGSGCGVVGVVGGEGAQKGGRSGRVGGGEVPPHLPLDIMCIIGDAETPAGKGFPCSMGLVRAVRGFERLPKGSGCQLSGGFEALRVRPRRSDRRVAFVHREITRAGAARSRRGSVDTGAL